MGLLGPALPSGVGRAGFVTRGGFVGWALSKVALTPDSLSFPFARSLLESPGTGRRGGHEGGPAISAPLALQPSKAPIPVLVLNDPYCTDDTEYQHKGPGRKPERGPKNRP